MGRSKGLWGVLGLAGGVFLFASGQQASAQSASAQAMLEEVVVTARRREENLQDLPLSIVAITADAMEAQGIYSIEDAGDFIPNVTLTQSDRANNTRIVIRGIGGGHPDPVFPFGSGMYIDGHYIPNSLGGYMTTMDIERVEVLRGPQGTLFGKNVTGGLVNIVTAKPGPEMASSLTLRAADHGQQDFRGMVNVPLSDSVFARVGIAKETMDGYYYNHNLGVDQGATDLTAFNAAIRFQPNDNWTIDLSYNKQDRNDDNKPIQCNPFDGSAGAWGGMRGGRTRPPHLDRTNSPLWGFGSRLGRMGGRLQRSRRAGSQPVAKRLVVHRSAQGSLRGGCGGRHVCHFFRQVPLCRLGGGFGICLHTVGFRWRNWRTG